MSKTIADYTAAISIDGANDFLLIEPSGNTVYKKISRNVLLGLSSAPLGLTDSQSPTNKVFDNTNTITLKDTLFTLQDDGDTTKQARFQLSGITTATTRTYTLPNASSTLADIATVQTFTNKTLTSPAITGGTIDNATITVDSISGHSTSTIVTIANLQISNGVLNSANAVTATSIADGAIQPKALVTGTGSGWAWTSYTPTLTNITLGNGTVSTRYIQIGKTIFWRGEYVPGTTSSVTGTISMTIPVTARSDAGYELGVAPIGTGAVIQSAVNQWSSVVYLISTTKVQFQSMDSSTVNTIITNPVNATNPFTWSGANGALVWNVVYEVP